MENTILFFFSPNFRHERKKNVIFAKILMSSKFIIMDILEIYDILSNTITPYFGIVIACAPSSDPIERTILAKVGQEAMGVKGIKAIKRNKK